MSYKKYKDARDAAWRVLLDSGVASLPVDLPGVCRALRCGLYSYSDGMRLIRAFRAQKQTELSDGFTILYRGTPYIFYNDAAPEGRQHFTIAHEIGHVVLGHMTKGHYLLCRVKKGQRGEDEIQANQFAARLLAPACVLDALDAVTAERIAALCGLSMEAAGYRSERMKELRRRNMFLTSEAEREVKRQFEGFIRSRSGSP